MLASNIDSLLFIGGGRHYTAPVSPELVGCVWAVTLDGQGQGLGDYLRDKSDLLHNQLTVDRLTRDTITILGHCSLNPVSIEGRITGNLNFLPHTTTI